MSDHPYRGYKYKVGESEIFVRNRLKSDHIGNLQLETEEPADAYISVTDTFVDAPPGKLLMWMPWNESRKPSPELYYAVNRALLQWTHYQKIKKIQVFCDAGTHRSVTVFGAFLRTYYTPKEAQAIVDARVSVNVRNCPYGEPLEYIDRYLEEFPEDRLFFSVMGEWKINRLDSHTAMIAERIKARFG